jgi:multidrug efflux pump subunit AcrA (membrane-fusion protein)
MSSRPHIAVAFLFVIFSTSCAQHPTPPVAHAAEAGSEPARLKREVRLTGIVEAVRSSKIVVPQLFGPGGPLTLTKLITNGTTVQKDDLLAVFDSTTQLDAARAAQAKYEDLAHQVDQKAAQIRADAEKRMADLKQAEGELAKAEMDLKKGPVQSEIERLQTEVKVGKFKEQVDSLRKSNALHDKADAAGLRIAELQRDRQKVALDRAESNMARLQLKAPLAGMVAHQTLFRNNSMGKAQEGDQLFRGQPLVSIFDPKEMLVRCAVGEPDGAALVQGTRATVYLDAYPDLKLPAHFEFASPVASSALGSPIKTFGAVFKLDKSDPHLMPDLSAAVVLDAPAGPPESTQNSASKTIARKADETRQPVTKPLAKPASPGDLTKPLPKAAPPGDLTKPLPKAAPPGDLK